MITCKRLCDNHITHANNSRYVVITFNGTANVLFLIYIHTHTLLSVLIYIHCLRNVFLIFHIIAMFSNSVPNHTLFRA